MRKKGNFFQNGTAVYAITLCICALALLVASTRIQLSANRPKVAAFPTEAPIGTTNENPLPVAAPLTPKPTEVPKVTEQPEATALPVIPLEEMTLLLPVTGTVQKNFSGDSLVKSETMRDWRVHNGIDITAEIGTGVQAAADGTVSEIFFDDSYGISICIDHGNGAKTLYQNLSTDTLVEEGQAVKKGDSISGVGDTASCELRDSPHLHFVMTVDGKAVNPMDYIKE